MRIAAPGTGSALFYDFTQEPTLPAFPVPPHTPFQWHDAPAGDTPLDANHLDAAEVDIVTYAQALIEAYDAWLQAGGAGFAAASSVTAETNRAEGVEVTLAPLASPALTGSPTAPTPPATDYSTKLATTAWASGAAASAAAIVVLNPTPVKTAAYTMLPQDYALFDTTGGSITQPLPVAPIDKTRVGLKVVASASANVLNFTCGGSDRFNTPTGPTTGTLPIDQAILLQYYAASHTWVGISDDIPLSQLDNRYVNAPGSPADGQLASYSAALGRWTAVNPTAGQRLAAATNVTGTPTTASAAGAAGTAVAIPGTSISISSSNGLPVVIRFGAVLQQTVLGDGLWLVNLVETTSGATSLASIFQRLPNSITSPVCFASAVSEFDVGVISSTRTFQLYFQLWSPASNSPTANLLNASNDMSFIRASTGL